MQTAFIVFCCCFLSAWREDFHRQQDQLGHMIEGTCCPPRFQFKCAHVWTQTLCVCVCVSRSYDAFHFLPRFFPSALNIFSFSHKLLLFTGAVPQTFSCSTFCYKITEPFWWKHLVFARVKQTLPYFFKKIHSSKLKKSLSVCAQWGCGSELLGGLSLSAVMASFPHKTQIWLKNGQVSGTLLHLPYFSPAHFMMGCCSQKTKLEWPINHALADLFKCSIYLAGNSWIY